jgi:hypothetical protein
MQQSSTITPKRELMNRFNPFQSDENAVAPEATRFTEAHVEPWPDGKRVRIHARLTPFQKPPNLSFTIYDPHGVEAANVLIIENIDFDFVITMHIRSQIIPGEYVLEGLLSYDELGTVDETRIVFSLPDETDQLK